MTTIRSVMKVIVTPTLGKERSRGAVMLNLGKSSAIVFSVYCPAADPR